MIVEQVLRKHRIQYLSTVSDRVTTEVLLKFPKERRRNDAAAQIIVMSNDPSNSHDKQMEGMKQCIHEHHLPLDGLFI